jgi:Flp pilus assembly protein TadD
VLYTFGRVVFFVGLLSTEPQSAQSFQQAYQQGLVAYARGDYTAAVESFQAALSVNPGHAQARFNLARSLRQSGDPNRALTELLAIDGKTEDRFMYLLALGRTYIDLGRPADATETLNEAAELRPKAARVHYLLGEALATQGKFLEARLEMEQAAEIQPEWVQPRKRLGEIWLKLGDPARAVTSLEKAVELAPDAPLILVSLGDTYAKSGRSQDAIRTLSKALELRPDMPRVRAQLANVLLSSGEAAKAFDQYRKAVEQAPGDIGFRIALALALLSRQRQEEADKELQEILKREPGNGVALYYLGVADADRGESALARERLEKAVLALKGPEGDMKVLAGRAGESYPLRVAAAVDLGKVLLELEDTGSAVRHLEPVVKKEPDHASAHYHLGLAYRKQGNREAAARELALFKKINDAREQDQLGLKALEAGDEQKAVEEFQKALEIYPHDRVAHGELSRIFLKRGDGKAAAHHLERVIESSAAPPEAWADLLQYYCQEGDIDLARSLHERALVRGLTIPAHCVR